MRNELGRRDVNWVMWGTTPKVTYSDDFDLEQKILKERWWEDRTAHRLTKQGYPFNFHRDYEHYIDKKSGRQKTVGLADDSGGIELKWISPKAQTASSAVSNAYRDLKKKRGVKLLALDNADSLLSDGDVLTEVNTKKGYLSYPTLVIGKTGKWII